MGGTFTAMVYWEATSALVREVPATEVMVDTEAMAAAVWASEIDAVGFIQDGEVNQGHENSSLTILCWTVAIIG